MTLFSSSVLKTFSIRVHGCTVNNVHTSASSSPWRTFKALHTSHANNNTFQHTQKLAPHRFSFRIPQTSQPLQTPQQHQQQQHHHHQVVTTHRPEMPRHRMIRAAKTLARDPSRIRVVLAPAPGPSIAGAGFDVQEGSLIQPNKRSMSFWSEIKTGWMMSKNRSPELNQTPNITAVSTSTSTDTNRGQKDQHKTDSDNETENKTQPPTAHNKNNNSSSSSNSNNNNNKNKNHNSATKMQSGHFKDITEINHNPSLRGQTKIFSLNAGNNVFPRIKCTSVSTKRIVLQDSAKYAKVSLVVVAFREFATPQIAQWRAPFEKTFAVEQALLQASSSSVSNTPYGPSSAPSTSSVLSSPSMQANHCIKQAQIYEMTVNERFIDQAMSGYAQYRSRKSLHYIWHDYYLAYNDTPKQFEEFLLSPNRLYAHLILLDYKARVRWMGYGSPTQDQIQQLISVANTVIDEYDRCYGKQQQNNQLHIDSTALGDHPTGLQQQAATSTYQAQSQS